MANSDPQFDKTQIAPQPNTDVTGNVAETVITGQERGAKGPAAAVKSAAEAAKPEASKKLSQLGDFKLVKKLGKGGMGEVFLAKQLSLDRDVALKTMTKELAKNQDFVARFQREAKSMARIDHPNIVKCYFAGQDQGINYAAIEFIDGRSMQNWMNDLGQLGIPDAVHVLIVCCEALKHAHDLKLVHRDIKPDNLLVTKDGAVKVADFGLAKARDEDMSVTQSGTGLGTPLFMSPEQVKNAKNVDHRTDIYALGSMLYYFVTGKYPFTGETAMELLIAKDKGKFAPARRVNPQVPERLDLMIEKMMMKDPNHRYKDCGEIQQDLEKLGIASESLSFIQSDRKVSLRRSSATAGSMTAALAKQSTGQVAAPPGAARSGGQKPHVDGGQTWYVRHKNPTGKVIVGQMTTDQILRGLEMEALDPAATASKSPTDSFLPLAQFPVFSRAVETRLVKARAAKAHAGVRSMYRWWGWLDLWWRLKRWIKKTARNVWGITSLVLYLGSVVAAIYFLGKYWREIWAWVSTLIGNMR